MLKDFLFPFFFFCRLPLIINPPETFFLPLQFKGDWGWRQRPDQLSGAAISTVLSHWQARKSGPYQRLERPSASQVSHFPPIRLFNLFSFSQLLSSLSLPFSCPLIQSHTIMQTGFFFDVHPVRMLFISGFNLHFLIHSHFVLVWEISWSVKVPAVWSSFPTFRFLIRKNNPASKNSGHLNPGLRYLTPLVVKFQLLL